jgi:dihydrofolate reductase
MPQQHSLTAIVAATKNNGIGLNGSLPWRLPGEMKYFAKGMFCLFALVRANTDRLIVTTALPPTSGSASTGSSTSTPNAVIMGRKTWESIPSKFRPLKDRQNLVISRQGVEMYVPLPPSLPPLSPLGLELMDRGESPNTSTYNSLPSALDAIPPSARAFLIGGSQLYNLSLTSQPPLVDRVLLTRILADDVECDTFLYDFTKEDKWVKASHGDLCGWIGFEVDEVNEEKGIRYRYEMWTLRQE